MRRIVAVLFALSVVLPLACKDSTGSGVGRLMLVNSAVISVNYVYIRPCGDSSWGDGRLEETEVVLPGASRSWDLPAGCYDARAIFAGAIANAIEGIRIRADETYSWRVVVQTSGLGTE